MKLLLHICCGPCSFYPLQMLSQAGISPVGYFFNPNIHPFREYERRVQALQTVAGMYELPMVWDPRGYDLNGWFSAIGDNMDMKSRCPECYQFRMLATVLKAVDMGFDAFTTTLLYSKYQRHEAIIDICNRLAKEHGIEFWYHDFREGWQQGIDMAVKSGIYRQPYCGCIFSERERYGKREKRLSASLEQKNCKYEEQVS